MIKRDGLVEVGPRVHTIPLQGDVLRTDVSQFEYPCLNSKFVRQLNCDLMRLREIAVHEQMFDPVPCNHVAEIRPPLAHRAIVVMCHVLFPREELPKREHHLVNAHVIREQVVRESGEEGAQRAHQEQHWSLDSNFHRRVGGISFLVLANLESEVSARYSWLGRPTTLFHRATIAAIALELELDFGEPAGIDCPKWDS